MTPSAKNWARFREKPIFVFTADQDWAPEWAVEIFLAELRRFKIPLHIFRTNPSPVLDEAAESGELDQGWHPNFLPGSSHGSSVAEVVRYFERTFPGAVTARSHCFAEDTSSWRA